MTDKTSDDDDKVFFQKAMRGVRPLTPLNKAPPTFARVDKKSLAYRKQAAVLEERKLQTNMAINMDVEADTVFSYAQPGLSKSQWLALKQGKIPLDARLDLHGCTLDQALVKLEDLFEQALTNKWRCLCIIHGKSQAGNKPLIKNAVAAFLKARSEIIAYHSSPSSLGGTGSVLVLLKNNTHGHV